MTRANIQLNARRTMRWLPSFLSFAVFGYVYHWWSGDGRNSNVVTFRNFDIPFGPTLTQTLLEFMLISLLVLSVVGWLQPATQTRVRVQTALITYGLYALVALNPPVLAVLSSLGYDDSGGAASMFFVFGTIILEFIVALCFARFIFKFLRSVVIAWLVLPIAFWGLWFGFFLWSFQPTVALTCSNELNQQIFDGELARQKFRSWAARLEPIPEAVSLPPVQRIMEVTTTGYNQYQDTCRNKKAYDFKAAYHDLWFHIKFYGKDGLAYQAKVEATLSERLEIQLLGSWQVSKDLKAPVNPLFIKQRDRIGEPGMIEQYYQKALKIFPALRQSPCIAFFDRHDNTQIVGDLDSIKTIKNLYFFRAERLEQSWNTKQVLASLQRIAKRLGLGKINSWELETEFGSLPYACTPNKPYIGFQILEDRFITRFPSINVKTSSKEFVVQLLLAVDTPKLVVFENHVDAFENDSYLFTPLPNDIPWTMVTTNKLIYTGSPLIPKQKPK